MASALSRGGAAAIAMLQFGSLVVFPTEPPIGKVSAAYEHEFADHWPVTLSDPAPGVLVVGVDLVSVREVAESLARFGERYTRRVFTSAEIAYCLADPASAPQRFAARFAAKEATMKLLRVSAGEVVSWSSIEVRRSPDGWCDLLLHDNARALAERAGVTDLALSMSHELDYATATVIGHRRHRADDHGVEDSD